MLVASIVFLTVPQHSKAELAQSNSMPYVTLLNEFKLYTSKETRANEVIGSLSGFQSVQLAPIENDILLSIPNMDKVLVVTWLGKAWINLKEGAHKLNKLELQEQTLTLLEVTSLYDSPNKQTEYSLAPQTVVAIASINACSPFTPCHTLNIDKWYLIRTSWMGEKWINPYHYAEKYKGSPVEGMISIEKESEVYLYPMDKPISAEPKLKPQIVKPVEKYIKLARMTPPSVWYQINTFKGLRWIHLDDSHGLGFEDVAQVNLNLDIPVPFQYYKTPFNNQAEPGEKQQPQIIHAIGNKNEWYFVLVDGSGRWIIPAKEISSRLTGDIQLDAKLGVKKIDAGIELTEASVALDTPFVESSIAQHILKFTPQSVTASRIWTSPNGKSWYYIKTWQGPKWILP